MGGPPQNPAPGLKEDAFPASWAAQAALFAPSAEADVYGGRRILGAYFRPNSRSNSPWVRAIIRSKGLHYSPKGRRPYI